MNVWMLVSDTTRATARVSSTFLNTLDLYAPPTTRRQLDIGLCGISSHQPLIRRLTREKRL